MPHKDPEAAKEYFQRVYQDNKEKIKARAMQWYLNNKTKTFWNRIKLKYGLTQQQYEEILERQNYSCKLCSRSFDKLPRRIIHVDHCHKTGKLRGILCMPCNVTLGVVKDDPKALRKMIKYLKGSL
jgi:hypothetical protein